MENTNELENTNETNNITQGSDTDDLINYLIKELNHLIHYSEAPTSKKYIFTFRQFGSLSFA